MNRSAMVDGRTVVLTLHDDLAEWWDHMARLTVRHGLSCHAALSRAYTVQLSASVWNVHMIAGQERFPDLGGHELGHVLGLPHALWWEPTVMNPTGFLRFSDPHGLREKWLRFMEEAR